MKIKLIKLTFKNGDISIETDMDCSPFSKIVKEEYQNIIVDDRKWKEEQK